MNIFEQFNASMTQTWYQLAEWIPKGLAALVFLLAGYILANLGKRLVIKLLTRFRVEEFSIRTGIDDFLVQGGVRLTLVSLVGTIFFWMIMFFAVGASFHAAGLEAASDLVHQVFLYVPKLFAASLILIVGVLVAKVVRGSLYAFLNNIKFENAGRISAAIYYVFLFFVVSITLEELEIGVTIVTSAFQMAFGSLCIAFALAFGFGGRKWASDVINKYLRK